MVEGPKVILGGVERVFAPLNFRAMRTLGPRFGLLSQLTPEKGFTPEAQDLVLEIVHASLLRNYPDVTLDEIAEHLDTANAPSILLAVLNGSGLVKAAPGEAQGP